MTPKVFNEGCGAGFWGNWDKVQTITQEQLDSMPSGGAVGFIH